MVILDWPAVLPEEESALAIYSRVHTMGGMVY